MAVTIADLVVNLRAQTTQFQAGMTQAQASMSRFDKAAAGIGGVLRTAIPFAAAAAAGATVKMAYDFDQSFTRIAALSNASAKDIEQWRQQVLSLSGATARSPAELADALFFLSSAGLKAGEVMPALEASAKAAAVGLGETADVANIVASALNAYANQGLTAAKVTDTLVAAVREGRAEPEEFANALGRILPIASKAGVEFDELTASLATVSNIGLDVNEGVTAMRGLLQALVAPGSQAAEAMHSIGISADEMRAALAEGGLLFALQELEKASGGNIDVLRQIVPNVRALVGLFGVTGQEADKVAASFDAVAKAGGSLNESLRETQQSDAFKIDKAINDIGVAAAKVGTFSLPLFADAISFIADSVGGAVQGLNDLSEAIFGVGEAADSGLDEADLGFQEFYRGLVRDLAKGNISLDQAVDDYQAALDRFFPEGALNPPSLEELPGLLRTAAANIDRTGDAAGKAGPKVDGLSDAYENGAEAARAFKQAQDLLAGGALGVVAAADEVAEAQREINRLRRNGRKNTEAFRDAELDLLTAQLDLREAAKDLANDMKESGAKAKDVKRALFNLGKEAGLTTPEARKLANQIHRITEESNAVPPVTRTKVIADTSQAREALNTLLGMLGRLEGGAAIAVRAGIRNIPQLAKGGLVTSPTLAMIGEAGPELVVPLNARRGGDGGGLADYWKRVVDQLPTIFELFGDRKRFAQPMRHRLLINAMEAIRDVTTPMEGWGWLAAMREELRRPGVSRRQHELMVSALGAIRETTTAKEAHDWARAIMQFDAHKMRAIPRLDMGGEVLRSGLAVVHKGETYSGVGGRLMPDRITVAIGRERFARQLAYDHDYRGW